MDDFHKHVFRRLDNLEAELHELREVTWPVAQGLSDNRLGGPFKNFKAKCRFFRFLALDEMRKLLKLKERFMGLPEDLADEEYRQIRAKEHGVGEDAV